jgi:hypothetical protein
MTTPDKHLTLGNTTYVGFDGIPEYVGVKMSDGTVRVESTRSPAPADPLQREHKLIKGMLATLHAVGVPVPCAQACATHRCVRVCNRTEGHPADFTGHVCGGCASAMVGVAMGSRP